MARSTSTALELKIISPTPHETSSSTPAYLTPTDASSSTAVQPDAIITITPPQAIVTFTPTAAPTATDPPPQDWPSLPVVPTVHPQMRGVFQIGLQNGNNPNAFSKVGDCETAASWFLMNFDKGPQYFTLGDYANLQSTIDQFQESYGRSSLAARPGFTVASVLNTYWADPKSCKSQESPLDCELRVHKPSFAFILLGTNDVSFKTRATFETKIQNILDSLLQKGVIPILATKADNVEGDNSINQAIATIAFRNHVPLWNFWAAVQPLPDHGLQEDGVHLTWAADDFSDPASMLRAWPVRNLTALQVLQAVVQAVTTAN